MGLEPTTPCLKGRCSNQLSYGPTADVYSKKDTINRGGLSMLMFFMTLWRTGKQEVDNSKA